MLGVLLRLFRLVWLFGKGHRAIALENLALRQQLAIYKRKQKRPRLIGWDRWFWIRLSHVWKDWRRALVVVHPDTVARWQRERCRRYWSNLSKRTAKRGRPSTPREVRALIHTMAQANPLWRAPRIHGELQKLGIEISERTVSRILRRVKRPPSQAWRTFLQNHLNEIVAIDFFTVPTIRLRVLYVFLVIEHQRRRVLHFGVTEHPTAEWSSQQVIEAFSDRDAKRYLIRDRDSIYGQEFRNRVQSLGLNEVISAPRSPWQNAYVERLIGSIRRECLEHVIVLSRRHLGHLLKSYFVYYHRSRTHLALAKDAPESRAVLHRGEIAAIPQVGGLHHRYERRAA
ncbi:MAG TPA: integrase core domain-containing protein [Terriglobales bacterium]|nr:integrase core domain-containing protein [Terriglobales bacterium]